MRPKEAILVLGGAILLTNVSIIGTLFLTGYFSNGEEPEEEPEPEVVEEVIEEEPEPVKPALHSMSQAILTCEDRVKEANSGRRIGYQVNYTSSKYLEEEGLYKIFVDTQTASRADEPAQTAEVTCEIEADSMTILEFKVMKSKN